jgi:hypothetical protein
MHGGKNGLDIAPSPCLVGNLQAGTWQSLERRGAGITIKLSQGLNSRLNAAGKGFSHWEDHVPVLALPTGFNFFFLEK